jgi:hypothetical protein
MKASSKYGSAYPHMASGPKAKLTHRHKVEDAVAKLPHERDESVDQVGGGVSSASVEQAGRDVKKGLPDTDRGVEMNRTYQKQRI